MKIIWKRDWRWNPVNGKMKKNSCLAWGDENFWQNMIVSNFLQEKKSLNNIKIIVQILIKYNK